MIDVKKLFAAAKAEGIAQFEARITSGSKLSVTMFNDEQENFTVADDRAFKIRGLADGKCGVFTSDRVDDGIIPEALAALKESARYGNPLDPDYFIDGNAYKYEKVNNYYPKLAKTSAERYIALAREITEKARKKDKRMELVIAQVEYEYGSVVHANTNGLNVKREMNMLTVFAQSKASDGKEVQSGMWYEFVSDLDAFDVDKFVDALVEYTVGQFGGKSVDSGKYKVVYSPDCVAALMTALGDGFSAFTAEQHMSLLEGKIGERVFSPLFTVEQMPIGNGPLCAPFDDEGVPCKNHVLIDKGVPTGYVYDLDTAKRAGVQSTGNGRLQGANVRPAVSCLTVHAGDKSRAELFETVGNGIYVTELGGVGTGLNERSGDYSLQAAGYIIENGKLGRPVSLITVAGNIITDFADIIAVGNDSKFTYYGITAPSVAIGSLSVSGVKQ